MGFGPVFPPTQRGLGHGAVHRLPRPVDSLQFIVLLEPIGPQLQKDASLGPFLESIVSRAAGADARRIQRVPLTAGPQHKEDGIHTRAIGSSWPTAAETVRVLMLGQ